MEMKPRWLSLDQVCALTSLSRTTINKWRALGRFPRPIDFGERRIAFRADDIESWMEAREAEIPTRDRIKPFGGSEQHAAA
jgi:prophage regulatory protein